MATNRTVTVKSSGGDYASLNAAFAGEVANLVSLDRQLTIECYNFEDTTTVTTAAQSWTTDATRYVEVVAVDSHGGKWSTSAYRLTGSANPIFDNSTIDNLRLTGIQFHSTLATAGGRVIRMNSGLDAGTIILDKCIIVASQTTTYVHGLDIVDTTPTYCVRNCVIYGEPRTGGAGGIRLPTATLYCYNNTIDGFGYALHHLSSATTGLIVKNTRATAQFAGVYFTNGTGTLDSSSNYNLTDSAAPTNWGANSLDSTDTPTVDYVDDSNATFTSRDYHIGATDSGIGAGVDLSGDATFPFSDDIDGETRG